MDRGGELRAGASARRRTSRPRSTRSSTISPAPSRPTAISTAGTTAASPTSAGPTCATTTSSTTPGHLLEGAIAYFRATGRRRLLDVMERYVDHIAATFGAAPGQKRGYRGHPGNRACARQALPPDRRPPAPRSRRLFHRRARPPAALFHRGSAGARRRSGALLGGDLRVQPVAHSRARADPDGRARGARHVYGLGDGRPRASSSMTTASSARARRCGATSPRRRCT